MLDREEGIINRLIGRIRALLVQDWLGAAGERFSDTTQQISVFAEKHRLRPKEILEDAVVLGRTKVEGLSNKEFAEATKNFAEAEQKRMDAELLRRSLESKVKKEEVEARSAEVRMLDAEIELYMKLQKLGIALYRDEKGNLTALPLLKGCDLSELAARRILASGREMVPCPRSYCKSIDTILVAKGPGLRDSNLEHEQWRCHKCGKLFAGDRNKTDQSFNYVSTYAS